MRRPRGKPRGLRFFLDVWVYPLRMNRWAATFVIAAASLAFAGFTPPVHAAAASDIPGTVLPSRTISSSVGGPTVDEVFAVSVPSGSVLIATVRGEVGSELGLYLFAPEAVSIATSAPIAQSARTGGVQSISLAIESGGTYYLNINGRNVNRAYEYTLSIAIARDTSPPTFISASMPARARSASVCATVNGSDITSGVRDVRVRETANASAATWMPYTGRGNYCVVVGAGDGSRSFDVSIRNGVGLVSVPRTFSVSIDDEAPTLVRSTPAQGGVMYEPRGSISWTFSEPIRLDGAVTESIYVVSQAGTRVSGRAELLDGGLRVRWTPLAGLPVGSVLLVAITGVSDRAGNAALPIDSLEVSRKQRSSLTLSRSRTTSRWSWLTYTATQNLVGKELLLETLVDGTWEVSAAITPATLRGSFRVERSSGAAIRLRWAGDERVDASKSPRVGLGG